MDRTHHAVKPSSSVGDARTVYEERTKKARATAIASLSLFLSLSTRAARHDDGDGGGDSVGCSPLCHSLSLFLFFIGIYIYLYLRLSCAPRSLGTVLLAVESRECVQQRRREDSTARVWYPLTYHTNIHLVRVCASVPGEYRRTAAY